jgi:entericidin B
MQSSQHIWEFTMKTMLMVMLSMFAVTLAACNTVEGAGKDVKATGAAVEKAADQSKPK